jgi:hypothetical protein
MRLTADGPVPSVVHVGQRRRLAQRVLDAHRGIDDSSLLSFLSGSVVDGLADALSDNDMSIVLDALPARERLEAACAAAGATPWSWSSGDSAAQQLVVAFELDGIEVQVAYASHARLVEQLDELLLRHNPDTPLHKLADGVLKAEPLFGQRPLLALQARLQAFPPELALAMARHHSATGTPWRALRQIVHRDAPLWCRELHVQACYRLLGLLAAVNARYYCTFQNKRLHHFAASLELSPPGLADRIEALLSQPPLAAARTLHALEGEVLSLVAHRFPALDLSALHAARAAFDGTTAD